MERFTSVFKSAARTQARRLAPSLLINLVPLYQFRYSFTSRKYIQTSVSVHQRVQPLHSTLSKQAMSSTTPTFYDLKADLPGDKTYDFEQLKDKVVLVVNVASQWYAQPLFL